MAPIQRDPAEVRRLLARLTVERMAAGWSVAALSQECGVHRSVIDRWESGTVTNPLLSVYAAMVKPLGLRLELVGERHLPLMGLDEFEIGALQGDHLLAALTKLRKTKGVTHDAR